MSSKTVKIIFIFIFISFTTTLASAQESMKIDLSSLIKESQQIINEDNKLTLVWWLPTEFWEVSFQKENNMSESEISEMISYIDPYLIYIVVDGKIGPFGGMTYNSDNEILSTLELRDRNNERYLPILEDDLNDNLKILLAAFKPIFASMLGKMGENMNLYVFTANDKNNNKIAELKENGSFKVLVGGREFSWDLPFESVIPPQTCPKCSKSMSGSFKYCPWDGTKLKDKE